MRRPVVEGLDCYYVVIMIVITIIGGPPIALIEKPVNELVSEIVSELVNCCCIRGKTQCL